MPSIIVKRGRLDEHDPWQRHRLAYDMGLWDFSYVYAVNTMDIDQSIGGVKTFLNFPVLPFNFPTFSNEAANKAYVDYTSSEGATFENLLTNGDVGVGNDQVARGDHDHANLPTDDEKGALETSQNPSLGNPFTTWNQFSDHHTRHEYGGADEVSLTGLSGGPITINGWRVKITNVNYTPYFIVDTDVHISFDTTGVAIVANLPLITSINHGQRYTFKDGGGNAGVNNIFITPFGSNQVDNGGPGVSFDIINDNEVIDVIANNTKGNWEIGP